MTTTRPREWPAPGLADSELVTAIRIQQAWVADRFADTDREQLWLLSRPHENTDGTHHLSGRQIRAWTRTIMTDNSAALRQARRHDSRTKRGQAAAALEEASEVVSFPGVARRADAPPRYAGRAAREQ